MLLLTTEKLLASISPKIKLRIYDCYGFVKRFMIKPEIVTRGANNKLLPLKGF